MSMSHETVKRIKKIFDQEYLFRKPWSDYICGSGIMNFPGPGESGGLGELCISVYLREPLPGRLALPELYQEVRLRVEVVGGLVHH